MRLILRWIGVKSAIIPCACDRTFCEVLGCKLAGVKTVGIQHGAQVRHFCVYDYMPGFDGEKALSLDKYGLWSDWWREYYIAHSKTYRPEQLYVSGHMRPLKREASVLGLKKELLLRVLFISEQLAAPQEVMPYLSALLEVKDFDLYLKFRPYRDGFELWLKEKQPEVYKKILEKTKILRGTMEEAISQCDVVVGSHSAAVLEAFLCLKPPVFFWTDKWGDYFDIKSLDSRGYFFAEDPEELIEKIRKSIDVPKEDLRKLQEKFFGDPYKNGSKWVVDQVRKFL